MEYTTSWGRYPKCAGIVHAPAGTEQCKELMRSTDGLTVRGMGRSYGDAALGQQMISTGKWNRILDFAPEQGLLHCESGISLDEVLRFIIPKGFFLPVVPGTKYVSIGGAIAADIHGKNHHKEGTFGRHVDSLHLMLSDGSIVRCSEKENQDLFWPTIGGMGLTGIITSATIRLKGIESSQIQLELHHCSNLKDLMQAFDENEDRTYSVGWLDMTSREENLGKSILQCGEHAAADVGQSKGQFDLKYGAPFRLIIPPLPTMPIFNKWTIGQFNRLYFRRNRPTRKPKLISYDSFFFPLDQLRRWNHLYGTKGFVQFQAVFPLDHSLEALKKTIELAQDAGVYSPLVVVKKFGASNPNSILSFPMRGYTISMDFGVHARTFELLKQYEQLVVDFGGKVYLAKDAVMSPSTFEQGYDKANAQSILNGSRVRSTLRSLQSDRIQLTV